MKGYRLLFTCTTREHARKLLASPQYRYEPKPAIVRRYGGVWEAWVPADRGGYRYTGSEAGCYS